MIHVYAIADGLEELPDVKGIEGAPPDRVRCNGFDLVVSEQGAEVEPTEGAVLAHARVVEALLPLTDALLPARFGVAYDNQAALQEAVRERASELSESLERVRGGVELGVRVVGDLPAPATADTGRAYLEARREAIAVGDEIHDAFSGQARAATRGNSGGSILSGAYLVDPDTIPAFLATAEQLEAKHPQLSFALTGPWPPYSFAGVDEP